MIKNISKMYLFMIFSDSIKERKIVIIFEATSSIHAGEND
jgi:hypothetical protein